MQAVADVASGGSEVVDIGDDSSGLLDEGTAILGHLGAPRGALEQFDAELVFELLHLPAERDLFDVQCGCSPRKTLRVSCRDGVSELADIDSQCEKRAWFNQARSCQTTS